VACRVVAGIDPSGGRAPWGFARLRRLSRGVWGVEFALELESPEASHRVPGLLKGVDLACVDAPTSPPGRGAFRPQERMAVRLGARLLPLTTPGMSELVRAGVALAMLLQEAGVRIVETHPGSLRASVAVDRGCGGLGKHSLDAIVAGIACVLCCEDKALSICSRQGCIVLTLYNPSLVRDGEDFMCLAVI